MASKAVSIIAGILALALIGAIVYAGNLSSSYQNQISQKEDRINTLEAEVQKLQTQLEEAKKEEPAKEPTQPTGGGIECADCHGDVSTFHQIETLVALDKQKGKSPRICTKCHGEKIHKIHEDKIENLGVTMCENCHSGEGGFEVPKKKPGDLLVCEQCHSDGNYIKIHNAKCERCHYGKVLDIHKPLLEQRYEEIKSLAQNTTG